jgi:hypothetical protein
MDMEGATGAFQVRGPPTSPSLAGKDGISERADAAAITASI